MKAAVFLDRDGVINRAYVREGKPYPPADISELEVLPGVSKALTALHEKGFMLVVVTNQPDVARGTMNREVVDQINQHLSDLLPIDEFRVCFHDNNDNCDCRKPLPGAILSAAGAHGIDLGMSYMVGDRWRDIEAGKSAGCKNIFIDYGYDEKQPESVDFRVQSLAGAAEIILGENS